MKTPWWEERKTELVSIARESGPVVLYCEETLNDIVFDLLSLEVVDGLFWDLDVKAHPRVLEALARLGAGFLYRREEDLLALTESRGPIHGDRFLKVLKRWSSDGIQAEAGTRKAMALPPAELVHALGQGGESSPFLVQLPAPATGRGALVPEEVLEDPGASGELLCQGAYLPWGRGVPVAPALKGVRSWAGFLDPSGTLVLGRGLGVSMNKETGRPDLERTSVALDALREAFPGMDIWVEPGEDLLATAGALLIPVGRVFEEGDRVLAEVGAGVEELMSRAWDRVKGCVQNLTGETTGQKRPVGLLGREGGRSAESRLSVLMPVPEEGDVLVVSRMGVAMPGTGAGKPSGETPKTRYLNARRICQVPL